MDRDLFDFAPEGAAAETEVDRPEAGEDHPRSGNPDGPRRARADLRADRQAGWHGLCRDDIDDTSVPGRREHARRGGGGNSYRPRRRRCSGEARMDATLGSRADERGSAARARHVVTIRVIRAGSSSAKTVYRG